MDVFTQLWTQIRKTWNGLNAGQRTMALVLIGLIGVALAGAGLWGGRADYVPLFPHALESQEEVGSILRVLQAAGIEVKQERGQILVPESSKDRAFMELSGKSAWPKDQSMAELNDLNNDWKMSDAGRKERGRLGLQARLSRMIRMMDGVQSADVLLAEGNDSVFSAERFEPKASVVVTLKSNAEALSAGVAENIRRMVAFGVQGVKAEAVDVADTRGRSYKAHPADDLSQEAVDFQRQEDKIEQHFVEKIRDRLAPIVGSRIAVTAKVILNRDREKIVSHKVNADEKVAKHEETENRTVIGAPPEVAGVPGVSSNLNERPAENPTAGQASSSTEEKAKTDWDNSYEDREIEKGVGDVKQATVGILIPYAKGAAKPDDPTLATYRDFAMQAAGITDSKFVTVAGVSYDPAPPVEVSRWKEVLAVLTEHGDQIVLLALVFGALLILGMALRRATRPSVAEGPAAAVGMEGAVAAIAKARQEALEPLAETSPEGMRFAEMETRVREMVRKDPRISAGLVKRWLMTAK